MTYSVADWYAVARADPDSDIAAHFPAFFTAVERHGGRVLELGVRNGASTSAWLSAIADRDDGHLWSVDIAPPAFSLVPDRWTFVLGDDCDPAVYWQLPGGVDVLFIDTSHAYDHTLRELELYVPRVRPGGVVLLHDTENEDPAARGEPIGAQPPFPVKLAVADYCAAHRLSWSNDPQSWGLATIHV